MSNDVGLWRPCCASDALHENRIQEFAVDGKQICLLRRSDKIFAFAATCPHAGGRFCEGSVDARGNVICPVHHYRFNPANGYNASGEGYKLKTFPAKEEEGLIFVRF